MVYKGGIIIAYGCRGIIQCRQQVLPDIPDFCRVLLHAGQHIPDVFPVQLHQPALYDLRRFIIPGDTDGLSSGTYRFYQKLQIS